MVKRHFENKFNGILKNSLKSQKMGADRNEKCILAKNPIQVPSKERDTPQKQS